MTSLVVTVLLLTTVTGCGTSEKDNPPAQAAIPPNPPADSPAPPVIGNNEYCELALFYRQELEKLRTLYAETHPDVVRARELAETAEAHCSDSVAQGTPSGQWVERDGQIVCDGYLTRVDDQDYCAAEVPDDWRPFTFDGELYYVQPLGNVEPAQSHRGSPREKRRAP